MSARRPSSSSSRRRGAMWTTPRAIRSKHASTASTAAAGDRSLWTSLSEKNCVRALILLDGADLAAVLDQDHRPAFQHGAQHLEAPPQIREEHDQHTPDRNFTATDEVAAQRQIRRRCRHCAAFALSDLFPTALHWF